MAIYRLREIRSWSREERLKKLEELRLELARLKARARSGNIENPGRLREIRRTIARILTVINEEEKTRS